MMAEAAKTFGVDVGFLTPQSFRTFALPSYRDLRVALPYPAKIAQLIAEARPDSIHIATEGPIGLLVRRHCRRQGLPFTTSFIPAFRNTSRRVCRFPNPGSGRRCATSTNRARR